ncbi:hypothetical protein E2C01_086119 [Portunus trituberculatus]|uniref:Secreted protein n=1 Tax=Portunus trituberculatus TaxID=210409 RepID=A0A5B7J9E9_PORTR|nr:hypothetical protein [Portunus trituberculatus]
MHHLLLEVKCIFFSLVICCCHAGCASQLQVPRRCSMRLPYQIAIELIGLVWEGSSEIEGFESQVVVSGAKRSVSVGQCGCRAVSEWRATWCEW